MGAFNYTGLVNTANRLIERFGQAATLRKPGEGFIGRGRDRRPAAYSDHAVTVVDKGIVSETMPGRDGASVVEKSRQLVMSTAAGVVPENRDLVLMQTGEQLTVVDVETSNPGGTAIVHKLKVEA